MHVMQTRCPGIRTAPATPRPSAPSARRSPCARASMARGMLVPGRPHSLAAGTGWSSIEHLIVLTSDIRAVDARVEKIRDRLILMGHAELVEQPDGFFHQRVCEWLWRIKNHEAT